MTPTITLSFDADVATVTLRRPEKLNVLNRALAQEMLGAFDQIEGARAFIVTGGDQVFCAGYDLSEPRTEASEGRVALDMLDRLAALPVPTIAAIEGYCLGGGLELALCCDLRIAGDSARLGTPEVLRGLLPGGGGTQRLPRLIGPARAKEVMFSGEHIDALTAERWGLVNRVVPAGAALPEARLLAERLAAGAPLAIREIKRLVDQGAGLSLTEALGLERDRHRWLVGTDDAREGVQAFLERRAPKFRAR
ncbi:MAG: enoyl-CoA hydratase/isomerase family protein [bacterium]